MWRLSFEMSDGRKWIRVSKTDYEVLEQLSSIERGRYLVWDQNPRPRGTEYVALILENDDAAKQLYNAIKTIPLGISGIPKLKNQGFLDQKRVLVIDYLPGSTLEKFIQDARIRPNEESRISVYEAIRLMKGLAHGIRFLHEELRLVHGDVKPENIILSGKPWQLQLIDFGTCWKMSHFKDRVEGDGCSRQFGAPEMFTDDLIDHRADQFSLGAVLYLLLVGKLPYSGIATNQLLKIQVDDSWKDPSTVSSEMKKLPFELRKRIDQFTRKLLRVNPKDRFQTTRQIVNEIESIMEFFRSANNASRVSTKPFSFLDLIPPTWKTFLVDWTDRD